MEGPDGDRGVWPSEGSFDLTWINSSEHYSAESVAIRTRRVNRMSLKRIRLELARDKDFPSGSSQHGYEFVAPLDDGGRIDAGEWHDRRDACRVLRFWGSAEHEHGHLLRRPGGAWAFHYEETGDIDVDDEVGYRFGDHVFRTGEYVSIREADEELRTFRVTSVSDLARQAVR